MKVLVTAASRHGSTAEMGDEIAETLSERGLDVEIVHHSKVTSLDGYDAVVIGSAIYAGRWLAAARAFAERFEDELRARPVWMFSSGPARDRNRPQRDPADVVRIRERIGSRDHRVFAGVVDRERLSLGEKLIVTAVRAPEGDFRPWDDIREWAASIAEELNATAAVPA
jgi:menaquinone-dependent protoporphyrinogen oxidase